MRDEDLDLRFCERFHESFNNRNAVCSLGIFFSDCESEVMFRNIVKFRAV